MLARHARRLLNLLDDTPMVPGDPRHAYDHAAEARQVLEDAETELRSWERSIEPISSGAGGKAVADGQSAAERESDGVTDVSGTNVDGSTTGEAKLPEEPATVLAS